MLGHADFEWDLICGSGGSHMKTAMDAYDYEVQHQWMSDTMPMDCVLMGLIAPECLALHYGEIDAAQSMLHQCMGIANKMLDEPAKDRVTKWFTILGTPVLWAATALLTSDPGDMAAIAGMMTHANLTWAASDATVHGCKHLTEYITDAALGRPGFCTAEGFILLNKLTWVLMAAEPGVAAEEVLASLPSRAEMRQILLGTSDTSITGAFGFITLSLPLLAALVCEKLEHYEEALPWAEAAASDDCGQLGSKCIITHAQAHRARGRCLAKLKKATEAAKAFEAAARIAANVGLHTEELLALSELFSIGTVDGDSCLGRMRSVVKKMLGPEPARARLESLAKAKLPTGVTLEAIVAAL